MDRLPVILALAAGEPSPPSESPGGRGCGCRRQGVTGIGRRVGHGRSAPGTGQSHRNLPGVSRINPTKSAIPGKPARREFEYKRNGTAVLFAALDVHDCGIAGWVTDSTRAENFVHFLADLVRETPKGLDLHCIADNLSAHKTGAVASFLEKNPHVHIHYTPNHASWLNEVELFFSILERRLLRRGEFASVDELADRMITFFKDYNRRAAPFRWTD